MYRVDSSQELQVSFFSNQTLELIVLPTEQCNFRCTYCYEKFIGRFLSKESVDSIKMLISKRAPELSQLRIGWFGGEPLLAKEIVYEISNHALQEAKRYKNLLFESGMSTNGYLLDLETAKRLIEYGVNEFQISLDGPSEIHNKTRVKKDGTGTFDKIYSNLLELKNSSLLFKINIRIHMSKEASSYLDAFVASVSEEFSNDDRFRIFLKTIDQLGGDNDEDIGIITGDEKVELEHRLSNIVKKNNVELINPGSSYICYAARPTSFVIRHNGNLVKCTIGLDDEENQIGKLTDDGKLEIYQHKMRPWLEGAVKLDRGKLQCPRRTLSSL